MELFGLNYDDFYPRVLILVLVEVVLGDQMITVDTEYTSSLNPCFSGSCSWSLGFYSAQTNKNKSLNPCFSGSCSWRVTKSKLSIDGYMVLILVLVEVVLGAHILMKMEY